MSDTSQGPGWWQASDGKWYPPEAAPGAQPPATAPPAAAYGAPPAYGAAPAYGQPAYGAPAYGAPTGPAPGQLADWITRVLATLIDGVLLVPLYIVAIVLAQVATVLGLLVYLVIIAAALYFQYLTGSTGASPGKRLMGIKVVKEIDGQVIGGGMGIARSFIHIIDGIPCYLGYFWPLWDAKKQTFTDKIMSTVVLANQPKQSFGPELFK